MPFATATDGTHLHYDVHGTQGPCVLLLQGLGLSARHWGDLSDVLQRELGGCRVITLDHRGIGNSDLPRGLITMARMADDAACVLDDARIDRALVVGHSMGGMVAQQLALRHPRKVQALALLSTTSGLVFGGLPRASGFAFLARLPLALRAKELRPALATLFVEGEHSPALDRLVAAWEPVLQTEAVALRTFLLQMLAVSLHLPGNQLQRITCPTVVATGKADAIVPPGNARLLAETIPHAQLELFEGYGHALPVEDPLLVPRLVQRLLERCAVPPDLQRIRYSA